MKLIIIAAALAALSGCAAPPTAAHTAPNTNSGPTIITNDTGYGTSVSRVVDKEARVVCYVSEGHKAGGISCIPFPALSVNSTITE